MIGAAQFHASPGVSDWRVVMSGVCAVFRAPSLAVGSRLVPSVVSAAEESGVQPDLDLRPEAVVVRVPLGDDGVPAGCAGFAATVSTAAGSLALVPDPSLIRSVDLYVAEHSLTPTREFWSTALGYVPSGDTDAEDPLRRGPRLAFNPIREDRPGRGRTHVDVSVPASEGPSRVAAALAAGGRLVDDSYAPAWWTLASPDNHGVDIASWLDTAD